MPKLLQMSKLKIVIMSIAMFNMKINKLGVFYLLFTGNHNCCTLSHLTYLYSWTTVYKPLIKHKKHWSLNFIQISCSTGVICSDCWVNFPLHFLWSDVSSSGKTVHVYSLRIGISQMAENPVKSTSQGTYSWMELTYWLTENTAALTQGQHSREILVRWRDIWDCLWRYGNEVEKMFPCFCSLKELHAFIIAQGWYLWNALNRMCMW